MFGQHLPIFQELVVLRRERSSAFEARAHEGLAVRRFSADMSTFESLSTSLGGAFL